ncbi:hypothetical protein GCM10023189_00360 [Nibrella saemangeumensis]|uniref:Uncharacterized protein n=1 Tax=Nibrella saemangeumensis TaxID=1084526 RepID=A0ABP8M7M5_9BACT
MSFLNNVFTSIVLCLLSSYSFAQTIIRTDASPQIHRSGIASTFELNENTPIFDKATDKRIPYREYTQLLKENPNGYHLEPVYDESRESNNL